MSDIRDIARAMMARLDADMESMIYGGTCSNVPEPQQPITAQRIIADMERIQRELGPPPPAINIVESVHAMQDGPRVRTYPKRKAKSASHWARMDKKWRKRYGYHRVPCIYEMDTSRLTGRPGRTIVAHPSLVSGLRREVVRRVGG